MGADGLVLHIGSHRGRGFETALPAIVECVDRGPRLGGPRPRILSRSCWRTLPEQVTPSAAPSRSWRRSSMRPAATSDWGSVSTPSTSGLRGFRSRPSTRPMPGRDWSIGRSGSSGLRCLHLNDSKVPFGANRDRHENIGEGTIGAEGLSALLGHPGLQGLPAILEVPGDGDGPRAEDCDQGPGGVGEDLLCAQSADLAAEPYPAVGDHPYAGRTAQAPAKRPPDRLGPDAYTERRFRSIGQGRVHSRRKAGPR